MKAVSFYSSWVLYLVLILPSSSLSAQSFQRTIYNSPNSPSDIFMVDLNHDGKPDLIAAQSISNMVTVFLNHGNGTFTDGGSATYVIGGVEAVRIVAADFDGDGNIDIATLNCVTTGQQVSILFGNGDGTFKNHVDYPVNFSSPPVCEDSLGLITLAKATRPSLVVSSFNSEIALLVNNGHGVFTQRTIPGPVGRRLGGVSAGDYNGDHLQDIAAISAPFAGGPSQVVIFYENADGSFRQPVPIFAFNSFLQAANTVDFNGDGKGDLLVPFFENSTNSAGVIALTNLGGGNFRSTVLTADPFYVFSGRKASAIHPPGSQAGLRGILATLAPSFDTGGDSVLAFFPAQGTTWGHPIYFDNPGGTAQATTNGDFNSDNRPDFAAITNGDKLVVFLNTTTASTCAYPGKAGVRICSPVSNSTSSLTAKIHASASGGALPIVAMKAYIDGKLVAHSDINTLDSSVATKTGVHTLTVNAWDPNDKVYQRVIKFTAK